MAKQKRIQLKHGYATVDEPVSQETIDALNRVSELAYQRDLNEKLPCNNCQGCGCTTCSGTGFYNFSV